MSVKIRLPSRTAGAHTIGRRDFAKISAVEGITLPRETEEVLREFDRQGLSRDERRRALLRKYARKD